jgi:hypothetical protein
MPEHYAVMEIDAVFQTPATNFRYIKSPLAGFIQDVYFSVGSNLPGDAVFDVLKNGTSLWAADLTQRPKILSGTQLGSKLAINTAIAIGDIIRFDLVTVPSGGIPVPFVIRMTLYDTIALRSSIIFVTASLAHLAIANVSIPLMGRTWMLIAAASDKASWVRAYVSNAARSLDSTRAITVDATENSGLGAEIIFTASLLSVGYGAPFPVCTNLDDPQSTDGLFAIQNRSGVTGTVQVTLQRLILER